MITNETLRKSIQAILVIAIFQLGYWFVLYPWTQRIELPETLRISSFEVASLEAPSFEESLKTSYEQVSGPWVASKKGPSYFAVRAQFDKTDLPDSDLALAYAITADNFEVYINGEVIRDEGRIEFPATYHGLRNHEVTRIPKKLVQTDLNTITILTARNELPETKVRLILLGEYKAFMEGTSRRRFMTNEYRKLTALIAGVASILALILLSQTRNKTIMFWLAVLFGATALRVGFFLYFGPLGTEAVRASVYFGLTCLTSLAWFNYLHSWANYKSSLLRHLGCMVFAVAVMTILIVLTYDISKGYFISGAITDTLTAIFIFGAVFILAKEVLTGPRERVWEIGALSLGVSLVVWDLYYFVVLKSSPTQQFVVAPFLVFALVAALLSRNLKLFESMEAFNEDMRLKLQAKEEEIEQTYKEIAEVQRARDIANERQRILRDMHDGIGSQLTGLLVEARSNRIGIDGIRDRIKTALTDLRLVVESLDNNNATFDATMASIRARAISQLQAAGIELDWRVADTSDIILDATKTLQISRIAQEAVANSIKHSDATVLKVETKLLGKDVLELIIADNGSVRKKPRDHRNGLGLSNMKARAKQIGANLVFSASPEGFLINLKVPI